MVREREAAEAGRQADRKEAADRMYEKVKKEMEDEMRRCVIRSAYDDLMLYCLSRRNML